MIFIDQKKYKFYKELMENRKFALDRYKKLTKEFEFSKENIAKISELNDALSKRMEKLFDMAISLCKMFLDFQEEWHEDFYEYVIHGEINLRDSYSNVSTPIIRDKEIAEKLLWTSENSDEKFSLDINYTSDFFNIGWIQKEFLEPVPHTGVFKNHAFDDMKLCRVMEVLFNKQKCYTLQDALYMTAKSFQTEFNIETAKRLWMPDKKIKINEKIMQKINNRFLDDKTCRTSFVWGYDNKMKVFEIADRTTELLYRLYDEGFFLQKNFNEKRKNDKDIFNCFHIEGGLKYLNDNATPLINKKMAHYLCEATNGGYAYLYGLSGIDEDDEWSEKDHYAAPFTSGESGIYNWNCEHFNSFCVGNHKINYFMHTLFADAHIYTLQDILYMKPEDWSAQFNIYLSDETAEK